MSLLGWQSRFAELVARLTGQEMPELVPPGLVLEDASNHDELSFLKRERLCFAGITAAAGGAGNSSGVILRAFTTGITVITGFQVQKPTAGFVSAQVTDAGFGSAVASFAFFRDHRWGPYGTARPTTRAVTKVNAALPAQNVVKRVQVAANLFTSVEFEPPLVMWTDPTGVLNEFGIFNETLNEAIDVMIDFYEREARPEELIIS